MCDNPNTYGLPIALVFEEFFKDGRELDNDKAAELDGEKGIEEESTS